MTSVSALENIHTKGLFGDYENKNETDLLKISESKNLLIVQIVQYKNSSISIDDVDIDNLKLKNEPLNVISNNDTRILHWAHYDHIKPWVVDEWNDKVDLFQDVPPYPGGGLDVGNIPIKSDEKAFDLWKEYKNRMDNEHKN